MRTLLVEKGEVPPNTKLLLFSAAGVDRRLRALGARDDVELIDLERMYHGD